MDQAYTEQVLKEILSKYGVEIICDRRRFGAALSDLLGKDHPDEQKVFRYALECPALEFAAGSITEVAAQKAVEQLEQEAHMREQDARFVVACILSARGYNPRRLLAKHMPPQPNGDGQYAILLAEQLLAKRMPLQPGQAQPVRQNVELSAAECFRNGELAEGRSDFKGAAEWYRQAAVQGHSSAAYSLGRYYEYGRKGVAKDDVQAAEWYRRAAGTGHGEAACSLAWLYARGQGVTLDYQEAKRWCNAARNHGYEEIAARVEQFLHEQGEDQPKGPDCLQVVRCSMNQGESKFFGGLIFHSGVLQMYQDRLTFIKDDEGSHIDILWREVVKSYTDLRSFNIFWLICFLIPGIGLAGAFLFEGLIDFGAFLAMAVVLIWLTGYSISQDIWIIVYPKKRVVIRFGFGNRAKMKKILRLIKKGRKGQL